MGGSRTEQSATLALILAFIVLLFSRGSEAASASWAVALAGALAGAGIALAVVRYRREWSSAGGRRRSAREKCDEIRDLLVTELHALEGTEAAPQDAIRMSRGSGSGPGASKAA